MGSTVRSRPNHYEALGLTPTATSDEIARAFARQNGAFRPHTFGTITELCVAYATLRDPIKRRAYDHSLGIVPKPLPPVSQLKIRLQPGQVAERAQLPPLPSFLLQKADEGARQSGPAPVSKPDVPPQQAAAARLSPEPQIGSGRSLHLDPGEQLDFEAIPIDWKRTGTVVGGVIVAACLLGGLAGWWSATDVAEAGTPAVSVPLPPAKPRTFGAASLPTPAPVEMTGLDRATTAAMAKASPARMAAVPREPAPTEQPQQLQPDDTEIGVSPSAETEAEAQPAATVAASLPLPNKVIARTIEQIGYACGAVASADPVEGEAAGVYKITCTSGQSYQARPVNGRYRFRRWGRS